jgi:sugar lactone lactonase YvrE
MRTTLATATALLLAGTGLASAQAFVTGGPLGTTNEAGEATPISDNVKVYGSFRFAESCTFDPDRNLIVAMNLGVPQATAENDGYVSLINPDGTVHTTKWIGVNRDGLTLNDPRGSAIAGGRLYTADNSHVRWFDLATGAPGGEVEVPGSTLLNGIAVTEDGTIFVSNTREPEALYRITANGEVSTILEGAPLVQPNGVAIDNDGNVVVVNIGNNEVLTLSHDGELLNTEHAHEGGNDGVVVLEDGTKYVSSVRFGSVSKITPGMAEPEVIAVGIPSAASMCYDATQNQLVIPMNNHNALAFISLN